MRNLAIFDLDHTLLPVDSDYEWGQFLCRIGVVDAEQFAQKNAQFYAQYQNGTLDAVEYLEFALGTLAQFTRVQLDAFHAQFMHEIIQPALHPAAQDLLKQHQEQNDEIVIITATNRFVTEPIAQALGVKNLLAAEPELDNNGEITGKLRGIPSSGAGKVHHLSTWLAQQGAQLSDYPKSYFYSDSQNDIPLLSLVTHPIATNPNDLLRAHANSQGWTILELFPKQ